MDQSDRRRFDAAISKLLYALNGTARVSPTVIGAYWSVLKGHTWTKVADAMTTALRESAGHMSPAGLSELCRHSDQDREAAAKVREERYQAARAKADQEADRNGVRRFGSIWHDAEFQAMKDVANMEYRRRCTGSIPGGFRFPTDDKKGYDGKFDFMEAVNAAALPKSKKPNHHATAWEAFWKLLREEFELFVKNQQVTAKPPEAL